MRSDALASIADFELRIASIVLLRMLTRWSLAARLICGSGHETLTNVITNHWVHCVCMCECAIVSEHCIIGFFYNISRHVAANDTIANSCRPIATDAPLTINATRTEAGGIYEIRARHARAQRNARVASRQWCVYYLIKHTSTGTHTQCIIIPLFSVRCIM